MDSLIKRRNSLKITDEELDSYMQTLVTEFGREWLARSSDNPIQILWKRNDELATNELYSLAWSVKVLLKIDKKWTKEQIKQAKSPARNNRQGAILGFWP
jgi:hypothetical protein